MFVFISVEHSVIEKMLHKQIFIQSANLKRIKKKKGRGDYKLRQTKLFKFQLSSNAI